jgi:putative protease
MSRRSQFVGEVLSVREDGWAEVETKNKFAVGDTIEIIHPSGNRHMTIEHMQNSEGQAIDVAAGNPMQVWFPVQGPADGALIARLV